METIDINQGIDKTQHPAVELGSVKSGFFEGGHPLPLVIQPAEDTLELINWVREYQAL